jgi:DNA-directed RNA polymerase I, II, and III subunit RPABC1
MDCAYTNFGRTVENFTLDELMVNISHHSDVPKHEIMTSEEKPLLSGLKLKTPAQLQSSSKSDPMARYIGARPAM